MARKTSSGRNAAGAGSIRKKIVYRGGKKYEYWEGRITVGFDPGTGKQIQKSFTGKAQKENHLIFTDKRRAARQYAFLVDGNRQEISTTISTT